MTLGESYLHVLLTIFLFIPLSTFMLFLQGRKLHEMILVNPFAQCCPKKVTAALYVYDVDGDGKNLG